MKGKHYFWLDLIRFIAAFLVLACHFRSAFFVDYSSLPAEQQNILTFLFYSITRLGAESVIVFFVMSGFLVGGKAIDKIQNKTFNLTTYIIDRTIRIGLPLISTLLLFLVTNVLIGKSIPWKAWLGNLFSLQEILTYPVIEPLWSLAYEVWFYILLGSVFLLFSKRYKPNIQIISWIILIIVFMVFSKLSAHYLFIWIIGAFSYTFMPRKNTSLLIFSSIISIGFIILLQLTSGSKAYDISLFISRKSTEIIFAFSFSLFMQQLIQITPKRKVTILINSAGTWLASFSYTLYLTHVLVLRTLEHFNFPKSTSINIQSILLYCTELIIAIIVAYIIYWCFEKRTNIIKDFIKRKYVN